MPEGKNFILISEDGSMATTADVTDEDMRAANVGYLEIIRLSDLHRYIGDGEWEAIEAVESSNK